MFHILQGMNLGQLALLAETDLRGRLTDQLVRGCAECMVCLERVRQHQATWDCHNCYQVNIFFIYLGYVFQGNILNVCVIFYQYYY